MLTGWQYLGWSGGTSWFYFFEGDNGRMATGTHVIEGETYIFNSSGALVS
jgi:glucan-binding YG repeat protein